MDEIPAKHTIYIVQECFEMYSEGVAWEVNQKAFEKEEDAEKYLKFCDTYFGAKENSKWHSWFTIAEIEYVKDGEMN